MTEQQILAILTPWQTALRECESRLSEAIALFGGDYESPLPMAVEKCISNYTKLVAEHIGCWDADALIAWWTEHNFGERPMQIGFPGEPLRSLGSTEALAEFIAEDLRRAA